MEICTKPREIEGQTEASESRRSSSSQYGRSFDTSGVRIEGMLLSEAQNVRKRMGSGGNVAVEARSERQSSVPLTSPALILSASVLRRFALTCVVISGLRRDAGSIVELSFFI